MEFDKYLTESIKPIIDEVLKELVKDKPDDPIPVILKVLEAKNGNAIPPLSKNEELELKRLKDRWHKIKVDKELPKPIKITIEEEKSPKRKQKKAQDTDSSSDSDDDTPAPSRDALLKAKPMAKKPPRASVSAEVIGCFNKRSNFNPKIIDKDDETKEKIKNRLKDSFMFKNLEDKDMNIVVDAMKEVKYNDGDIIIEQGDDGNELYVVESGECEWFKFFPENDKPTKLRDYVPGEAFGELALLYNAPRAASIKAIEDCTLYALDRETFNNIVKAASKKNRETYEDFLKSVDLLSSMDYYERVSLSDALKKVKFSKGDYIIREGEPGDSFYFVIDGKAVAQKEINGQTKNVMEYGQGDYFGERALITNEPRAASIVWVSDEVTVAKLENRSFKRLLGPVEDILMRNMKNYAKYHSEKAQ